MKKLVLSIMLLFLFSSTVYGAAIQGKEEGTVVSYCKSIDYVGASITLTNTGLACTLTDSGAAGGGDISDVGDCTTGACFEGTAGTTITGTPGSHLGFVTAGVDEIRFTPTSLVMAVSSWGSTITGNLKVTGTTTSNKINLGGGLTAFVLNGVSLDAVVGSTSEIATELQYIGIQHSNTASAGSRFMFARSKGTLATPTIVADDNVLAAIDASGFDGTDYVLAGQIDFEVDGTPGGNDMPGRIIFKTTADGGILPTERMRISSTGMSTFTGTLKIADGNTLQIQEGALGDSTVVSADIKDGEVAFADLGADIITGAPAVGTFASGDTFLCQEAGVGVRECDYDDLPAGAGSGFAWQLRPFQANLAPVNPMAIAAGNTLWGGNFDDTTDECATWQNVLTPYNAGSVDADCIYTLETTSSSDIVELEVYARCVSDNEALSDEDSGFDTVNNLSSGSVSTTAGNTNLLTATLSNFDSCAEDDLINIRICRDADDTDTTVDDVYLRGCSIHE
jgi:hypothetical protein